MKKIEMCDTYGYEEFITFEEQLFLLKWIEENISLFKVNPTKSEGKLYGSRKMYIVENENDECFDLVKKIKNKVIEVENIMDWIEEPHFKDLIGINGPGGSINQHTDPNIQGYTHTRYNVILKYPTEGGHSIYNGKINVLKENMVWRCVAGKVIHGSVPVKGEIPRITLSLGFLIKNELNDKTYKTII
jgi:hypothetical protein